MGNITVITKVNNNYNGIVQFVNTETSADNRTVQPGASASPGAWVPWCDDNEQFPMHHIQVSAEKQVCYVYQHGPDIFTTPVGFNYDSTAKVAQGNNYELNISSDFVVSFTQVGGSSSSSGGGSPLSSQ